MLYMLDFSFWRSMFGRFIRVGSLCIVALMFIITVMAQARASPHGLIMLYSLGTAAWFIAMKHLFYNEVVFRDYVSWIAGAQLKFFYLSVTLLKFT